MLSEGERMVGDEDGGMEEMMERRRYEERCRG